MFQPLLGMFHAMKYSCSPDMLIDDHFLYIYIYPNPEQWLIDDHFLILSGDWMLILPHPSPAVIDWWSHLSWAVIDDHCYPEQCLRITFILSSDWGSLLSWAVIEDHFFILSSDWGSLFLSFFFLSRAVIDWWSLFYPEQWLIDDHFLCWALMITLSWAVIDWRPHIFYSSVQTHTHTHNLRYARTHIHTLQWNGTIIIG